MFKTFNFGIIHKTLSINNPKFNYNIKNILSSLLIYNISI